MRSASKDDKTDERRKVIDQKLATLKQESADMRARWNKEKEHINTIQQEKILSCETYS